MTWTKTGDEYADECWRLSDAAYRLHHEGLTWSNRRHLDGRLAKDEMSRWARRPEAAKELVSLGFWHDCGDHYQIYAHQGWQRTAEQWMHQSAVNRANRAKGKARPVRPKTKPLNESSDESSDERDRTGQDRTDVVDGTKKNGSNDDGNWRTDRASVIATKLAELNVGEK